MNRKGIVTNMNNIEKIRQAFPKYKCDAVLVTDQVNRFFCTGFSSSAGTLFITEKDAWYIVDSRYIEAAEKAIDNARVTLLSIDETFKEKIKALVKECNVSSLGFEESIVSYAGYKEWRKEFGAKLVPAQKLINDLRAVKSRADLDKMIKAQRLAEKVFNEILPLINTGATEKDIAAEIIYRCLKHGADDKAFDPIVVSGPNSSRPHGVPGNEKIAPGFLTIDFGVKLDGWCSDTTRTLCIGEPDEEMIKIYDAVLKAQETGIKAIRGGVKAIDVDSAARSVIEDAGYGDYFDHGFGHSIGLEVHEPLKASQLSKDILPVGAVISAEPGIYLPGRCGVRIEDLLYITESGSENLTNLPKALTII